MPIPDCFDYCSLVVLSEVWEGYAFSFVLSPEDCIGNSGSFLAPYIYIRTICSSSVKNAMGNLIEIALYL